MYIGTTAAYVPVVVGWRAHAADGGIRPTDYPPSPAFACYVEWYSKTARARGCDPNSGPRLPGLLRDAGFGDIAMSVVQPAGFSGEVKIIAPITMEMVADAMVAADVATSEDVDQTIDELYTFANTEGTVQSLPRIVQTWGRRVG